MSSLPVRKDVPVENQWDLSSLYSDSDGWERDLERLATFEEKIASFSGRLGEAPETLAEYLELSNTVGMLEERLGYYAMLRQSEDAGDSENQSRYARFMQVATRISAAGSFFAPEIQRIDAATMERFLAHPQVADYRIALEKILRYRPHTLSQSEERLLAMQSEFAGTAQRAFGALTDVDFEFGEIETPSGAVALTHSSFGTLQEHADRGVRERSFKQFYRAFEGHKNTLAALYNGSVQRDVYMARVRSFGSAIEAGLFPDDVPVSVYDNLVSTIRESLPILHRYYALRKRVLKLDDFAVYDTKVPLVAELQMVTPYERAVELIGNALAPLGDEYVSTLSGGLTGGWVDRYENKGKRSGAFSAGSFVGNPYILMNYRDDSVRHVFTLAHEGGHSMHSWYSVRSNPFQHYHYTIFEAEVASTFNEQLLHHHMLETYADPQVRTYLLNKHLDDMIGTLFRQTMFAEFERTAHAKVEAGEALTVDSLRASYRELVEAYFGPEVELPEELSLEGLRIPHFYRAFYVYKYATGISAAITLARRVLQGGAAERDAYFSFLRSGGSRYPIESLKVAGVDMASPEPIREAMAEFEATLIQLEKELT